MEDKVTAIYALREAAARHAKLEMTLGKKPRGRERDRLLDARIELEQKTQEAVEACVHCGRAHSDEDECGLGQNDTVIPVDFTRRERGDKTGPESSP